MAEFQEVMQQRKRMCNNSTCNICDLSKGKTEYDEEGCEHFTVFHYEDAEKIILDWAKKHPEPQYPTWKEWYTSTFPDRSRHGVICPRTFMKHKCMGVACEDCYNEQIPADIAEKLGIKLKEVK